MKAPPNLGCIKAMMIFNRSVPFNSRLEHVGASHCQKGSDIQIHELYKARSSRDALLDNAIKIVKMNKPKAKSTSVRKSVSSEKLTKRLMAETL